MKNETSTEAGKVAAKTPKTKADKTESTAQRGRPVNPTSNRQIVLTERELRREAGEEIKRGRPVAEGSARQKRLADRAERAKLNGGVVKRGRPAKAVAEVVEVIQVEKEVEAEVSEKQ